MIFMGEPVKFGSPTMALDLIMYTQIQQRPSLNNTEILSVFNEMSPLAFAYSFYCLLLIAIILTLVAVINGSKKPLTVCRHFLKALWSILETAIDQENYQPSIVHAQVGWLFLNFFTFVFVFGYFLNFISVNQIAQQPDIEAS